jgi:5-methylcytosine-specific restriction endonuclease McrA
MPNACCGFYCRQNYERQVIEMAEYQKICVVCSNPFIAKQKNTRYCSKKCGQAAYRSGVTKSKVSRTEKITDEQLSQAIDEGLTRQEIADKYGMHVESIARRMQRLRKYAGNGDQLRGIRQNWGTKCENLDHGFIAGCCWHYIESQDKKIKENHKGFIYLEGRTDPKHQIRIKCKTCGSVFERNSSVLRSKNITCEYCAEKEKQQIELQNERVKLMRFFVALKEIKTPKICKECKKEYYSQFENSVYCSKKCRMKYKRRFKSIRSRCRHYGVYYDPAVKPDLVIKRDKYICQICGMATNPEDKSWNGYIGPYYPTVDHIIALANGGPHTWENVQCAHAKCNSWKRDLLTV